MPRSSTSKFQGTLSLWFKCRQMVQPPGLYIVLLLSIEMVEPFRRFMLPHWHRNNKTVEPFLVIMSATSGDKWFNHLCCCWQCKVMNSFTICIFHCFPCGNVNSKTDEPFLLYCRPRLVKGFTISCLPLQTKQFNYLLLPYARDRPAL